MRPPGQLVANLGDRSPFQHGGYFIYEQPDGTYEGHYWEDVDSGDDSFVLYTFDIPADVYAEYDWAARDVANIAATIGCGDPDQLLACGRSSDPLVRAEAMRDIAGTWGWHEFGPERLVSEDDLRHRYGRDYEILQLRSARREQLPDRQLSLGLEPDDGD